MQQLKGVFVATVSPFDREGNLSLSKLREHFETLAKAGVAGLVPGATTGEGPTLSREERRAQLEIAREIATQYGIKVIAGCGGNNTHAVLDLVQEAEALGCDAAMVVTPYYNKPTQSGLVAHFEYIADRTGIPLVVYHIPPRTNVSLELETLGRLFAHRRIIGVKEASGQYGYWLSIASQLDIKTKSFLAGDDDAFAMIGSLGGSGIISASANVAPAQFVQLYQALESGDLKQAFEIQKKLNPLVRSLFLETNPGPIKYALHRIRGHENSLRLPLVPVKKSTETAVMEALKKLELWRGA